MARGVDYDGHWSVSVAESPYDPHSYSIYIKTHTHNVTLTRTAAEILDLDHKLRQAHDIPQLPDNLPLPPKRKSTFLNTLSRLASPSSIKHNRRQNSNVVEHDVFSDSETSQSNIMSPIVPLPSAVATALAAYLTSVSNTQSVRADRVWKRFVRVRTDDLESVRVERAIKRVRSDVAAHLVKVEDNTTSPATQSLSHPCDLPSYSHLNGTMDIQEEQDSSTFPPTPLASSPRAPTQTLLPRSQSAEPRKSRRISHYTPDLAADESQTTTGDESSLAAPESKFVGDGSAAVATTASENEAGEEDKRRKKSRKSDASKSTNKKLRSHRKVCIDDFQMLRVLGKGCAGKVLLVRHQPTSDLFALKAITKRHVLAHQELQHTLTEQAVLRRMAAENRDPFVVKLWWSFHDKENLFLVMDFHPGGDLATQLARWGRLGRDRARFYAAEIVEGVEGLHAAGVIYRDLKPENILIGGDGHIVLTDFGLSKEFPRTKANQPGSPGVTVGGHTHPHGPHGTSFYSSVPGTPQPTSPPWMESDKNGEPALGWGWPGSPTVGTTGGSAFNGNTNVTDMTSTFCGTAEYLAPEVIQGLPYSYEVDWWSFGTMLYEMLTGITPFWANNHSDMYVRVLQDELQFPDDRAIDQDTKSLIRGLLQRVPSLRICEPRIKKHPYFSMIDWSHVFYKRYIPPYIPPIDPSNASDTQNFDDTFLDMEPVLDEYREEETENESEGGRRVVDNEVLTDVDTDQEPHTDGVDTDGRAETEGEKTDVEEEQEGTPSQSRSSSVRPTRDGGVINVSPTVGKRENGEDVDVFDGYSFKGRDSVLLEDEEEGDGGSSEEMSEGDGQVEAVVVGGKVEGKNITEEPGVVEEGEEPKTPEARQIELPAVPCTLSTYPVVTAVGEDEKSRFEEEIVSTEGAVDGHEDIILHPTIAPPPLPPKPTILGLLNAVTPAIPITTMATTTTTTSGPTTRTRTRKPRSGIPALDRHQSDTIAERASDASASENEEVSDDEIDEWDLVEKGDGEDRNGLGVGKGVGMRVKMRGGNLFSRGVVDRYRLKVFGNKLSVNSNEAGESAGQSRGRRVVSGMSAVSGRSFGSSTLGGGGGTPAQKEKKEKQKEERRGRTPLTFRKHPREFLRARSPKASTVTTATIATTLTGGSASGSRTVPISATSSLAGILLTPSHSVSNDPFDKEAEKEKLPYNSSIPNSPGSPSLKSKESSMSVGGQSRTSSDQSTNGPFVHVEVPEASASELMLGLGMTQGRVKKSQQQRKLKLKKYNEKVLSLFSSPKGVGGGISPQGQGSGVNQSNSTLISNVSQPMAASTSAPSLSLPGGGSGESSPNQLVLGQVQQQQQS